MTESNNDEPLLSVIIPSLAVDQELRRCLDSVSLAIADKRAYEIVLVMPTALVVAATAAFPGVRVVAESRPSLYGAMNDGAISARGRFLYFLGKDDIVLPAIVLALDLAARDGLAAVFSDVYWGATGVRRGRTHRWLMLVVNVCHQGVVYSRDAFAMHGPYVRRFRVRADHFFNIRLMWDKRTRHRVKYHPYAIAWFSGSGVSAGAFDWRFARVQPAIIRRYLGPVAACAWQTFRWLRARVSRNAPEYQFRQRDV